MNIPIVLVPTNRSYIDFLIVSYIFFAYKLKLPYVVSDEAFLSMRLIPFLIRSSGAFFYRKKSYKTSKIYKAIFYEYIQRILIKGNNLEFFIEGTRSRTGKILQPEFEVLDIIMETTLQNKLTDVCLVPLTINYEKVLEGDTFPS
jgi:glycerol-3-phosphate O-acyltransferase